MRQFRGAAWMALAVVPFALMAQSPPEQPLPFSHKTHVGTAKLACADCHPGPAKFGEPVGFPAAPKCMACHVLIAKDKPSIQKLASLAKSDQSIPWTRVYALPDFVFFDHRYHLMNEVKCEDCHGAIAEKEVTANELGSTKMTFCQGCHFKMRAATGCSACHNQR